MIVSLGCLFSIIKLLGLMIQSQSLYQLLALQTGTRKETCCFCDSVSDGIAR